MTARRRLASTAAAVVVASLLACTGCGSTAEAEQQTGGSGAWSAAKASGETWPSPLVIDMTRVIDDGAAVWQVTTCDTATNQFHVQTLP